ncbi:GNAT family N-acetyltransferase [Phenylobacterium sp.]|uniref:GNAT family N-acetyltransferase n=1 Tax=Phenylobacterium sp. TaxID=1871053 RepID=UPI00286A728D|nr:GNAT family N-acetyltransferase [Phenylobacterium sp.]
MIVRRAEPDEIDACARLYERVLRETFTWAPPSGRAAADFRAAATLEEVYVARDDERLLGFASLYRPDSFLHSLYVLARGRGVGKALLDHVTQVADGRLTLKCEIPNTRAQAFYLREGFRVVEEGCDPGMAVGWRRMSR